MRNAIRTARTTATTPTAMPAVAPVLRPLDEAAGSEEADRVEPGTERPVWLAPGPGLLVLAPLITEVVVREAVAGTAVVDPSAPAVTVNGRLSALDGGGAPTMMLVL
jgi:hypothetical protein